MKTKLVARIGALFAAVFTALASLAPAITPVPPIEIPKTVIGGLNVALTTSGYQFTAPPVGEANGATILPVRPVRDSFVASAVLQNRSRNDITFNFPDAKAAETKFTFRVFNAAGDQVWESDADDVSAQVITPATLQKGTRWKRLVRVPLVVGGAPLAKGIYTLQAAVEADKQPGATVYFEVIDPPQPDPTLENTGIAGKVLKVEGDVETPFAGAFVRIRQIIPADVRLATLPFTWSGRADSAGAFQVKTPAGRFKVTAYAFPLTPIPLANAQVSADEAIAFSASTEVTVEAGKFSEVALKLEVPTPPQYDQGISGQVFIGPIRPVEVEGEPNEAPLAGARVVIVQATPDIQPTALSPLPTFYWQGVTDKEGRFKAGTPVGKFVVTATQVIRDPIDPPIVIAQVVPGPPERFPFGSASATVTVEPGKFSEVKLLIDSGIR
jgi:hypothetical protein